jgi:hypothetical protein
VATDGERKALALTGSLDGGGDPSIPGGDDGSSFTWADRGGSLGLPGQGLCAGDTLGEAGGNTLGWAALVVHESDVKSGICPGWTSFWISHGSSTGVGRGIP